MPGMNLECSKHEVSFQLNGTFEPTSSRGILAVKDSRYLNMFPICIREADSWMGWEDNAPLTNIHVQYT